MPQSAEPQEGMGGGADKASDTYLSRKTTATLFTPLHAKYSRRSGVATILPASRGWGGGAETSLSVEVSIQTQGLVRREGARAPLL